MRFRPPFCPYRTCPTRARGLPFTYYLAGTYRRRCDGRRVQRFRCKSCRRRFSTQTFRLDHHYRLPHKDSAIFRALVSKVTHRQAARMLAVDRKSVHRRLRRWGPALERLHLAALSSHRGILGACCLDELETFEGDRRLQPVTVPVLVDRERFFVVAVEVATLPPRGNLKGRRARRKEELEALHGPRKNRSNSAVRACLEIWAASSPGCRSPLLISDKKTSYPGLFRRAFPDRRRIHVRVHSKQERTRENPLFAANHSLAMLRDQVSRLVRRSWGASKLRHRLRDHLWVWVAWRNYVRRLTNQTPGLTPGMAVGAARRMGTIPELLRWRWPERMRPGFLFAT